jgi:hypothetical protein
MSCCEFGHLPKTYLHYARTKDNKIVQFFLSEDAHLKLEKLIAGREAKLLIVDGKIKVEIE